jgi:hypothetical protein
MRDSPGKHGKNQLACVSVNLRKPFGTKLEMWCRVTGCGFEPHALRLS